MPHSHYFSQVFSVMGGLSHGPSFDPPHAATWQPPMDIFETDECLIIVAELPGVDKEQIGVQVECGILKISGSRPKDIPELTRHVHQIEIPYGHFTRGIKLPPCAALDHIEAQYENGYLHVRIPKAGPK
ncbi:MAG TPA: Hsp20/alpha crystallin family protein [Candidatus Hydrogenedentes bacterium]|nr:Hsp20/alpha crystallin family protein [Candidatus Hydrogenedentota bacterium]